ncbi:NUDIX hydrolase [Lentzea flaviverrucosa]|uniref:ADP-ribose pyrophosphatase YjhB, NUDIX family n=1 Tax=Lentzea flaviverrucosa TaxID=200379 RepID=A0A1H9WTM0_9PSEU|nr:NUDIX hydrolase [Lentzea flaviverrucosa]RDI23094.1 ADP-ribose pyrophosphatase YjhB (NUDIX family) [Lentzea flaviverrucosa]SES37292.1 ADP-ribose pyrophosphatase YjhB, NUDIX family [Lentzea flaviverrucosa]
MASPARLPQDSQPGVVSRGYVLGATCVVFDPLGRVLLVRRRSPQRWELPGGLADKGEAITDTAVREVREETGVDVRLSRLVGVYQHPSREIVAMVFVAVSVGGEPVATDEASEVEWVSVRDARERLHPLFLPRLEDAMPLCHTAPLHVHEGTAVLDGLPSLN